MNHRIFGDWGLGIGDWGLGIGPNPQSPIFIGKYIKDKLLLELIFYSNK